MADNWEDSAKTAAQKLAAALENAVTLSVNTNFIQPAAPGGTQTTVATLTTEIHLDADTISTVPVRRSAAGALEVDSALYDVHARNVSTAMEYRARILNALLGALQSRFR